MSRGVHVTSFRALEELDIALARFASEGAEALQSVEPEINRKLELLERRREQCEQDVEYWQQMYDDADPEEDDVSYLFYRLEKAEDHLVNLRYWQSRVDELHNVYAGHARRVMENVIDHSPKARAFVKQKLSELGDYVSLKADSSPADAFAGAVGGLSDPAGSSSSHELNDIPLARLSEVPLPRGFNWVRLDEINPDELSDLDNLGEKSVSANDVRAGFEILRKEILPQIKQKRDQADSDYFWKLGEGRQGTNSFQGVYDAFFGLEPICVDRSIGRSHFSITNGRHRIKAARELGWSAVPAQVMAATLRKAAG